jgi:hypothetical protein
MPSPLEFKQYIFIYFYVCCLEHNIYVTIDMDAQKQNATAFQIMFSIENVKLSQMHRWGLK